MCLRLRVFFALTLIPSMFSGVSLASAKVLVTPSLGAEEMYISNPGNTSGKNGAFGADFRTSVAPALAFESGKESLRLNGSLGANAKFHKRDPSLNFIAYNGTAGGRKQFSGGSSVFLNSMVSYTKTSDSLADSVNLTEEPVAGSVTGLQPERTGRLSSSYSAGFEYVLSGVSSLAFDLSENFLFNETPRLFDTRTDALTLSYRSGMTKKVDVSGGYSFSNSSFDAYNYSFDSSPEGGNIATHSADMSMSWDFSRSGRVSFSGGYFITNGSSPVKGWTASADFSRALKLVDYNMGYRRSTTSTFGLSKEININESLEAGAGVTVNRMAGFSLDAGVSKNRSEPSGNVESRTYSGTAALNYSPTPFTTLAFTFAVYRIESRFNPGNRSVKSSYDTGFTVNYQFSRSVFLRGGYSHFQEWTKDFSDLSFSREVAYIGIDLKPAGEWYD